MTREHVALLTHARYICGESLGQGGQGCVLRVTDREAPLRALVAKVWRAHTFPENTLAGEFALLKRLHIAGLVQAHDFGRDEKTNAPFLVEDYVDGIASEAFIRVEAAGHKKNGRLWSILGDVAVTLASLHGAGFVHGDIKPPHIRVKADGRAVLLDLGAAIVYTRGAPEALGFTRGFVAPEVFAGGHASPRSDLFGLGATAWALAAGTIPSQALRASELRRLAPWVEPLLADLIENLLAPHPADRPASAYDVLYQLGVAGQGMRDALAPPPAPIGRDAELRALLNAPASSVRYVVGPSGIGKSHLLREATTRALLLGQTTRHIAFPTLDTTFVRRLVSYFRGDAASWPFVGARPEDTWIFLDDLHAAPPDFVTSIDSFRCRAKSKESPRIIAAMRSAPDGAETLVLSPLDETSLHALCNALHVTDVESLVRHSNGNPGWIVAALGRIPLTRDTALERLAHVSAAGCQLLIDLALLGGYAPATLVEAHSADAISELLREALMTRRTDEFALAEPTLASALATTLASFDDIDRLADSLLASQDATVAQLMALASADKPPTRRIEVLERAADLARISGLGAEELDALFALAASAERRSPELLCRLDRLTRDAGASHPQIVQWLDELSQSSTKLRPLALRRRAEQSARAGAVEAARTLAGDARAIAHKLGDAAGVALSIGTQGAVELFAADWVRAQALLTEAQHRLSTLRDADVDVEERARVEHNLGVVMLYRGDANAAATHLAQSLERKRALGDRAGVRSSLLNLGLAHSKGERFAEAETALCEALALARSLSQTAGRAWTLAALADLEVHRKNAHLAERFIAEAETLGDAIPAVVQTDLILLRAEVALLDGDGKRAQAIVARVPSASRTADTLVGVRSLLIEADAYLSTLPSTPARAKEAAERAYTQASAAGLHELEQRARAMIARADGEEDVVMQTPGKPNANDFVWEWLNHVAKGAPLVEIAHELARLIATSARAERAFVAYVANDGTLKDAWGVDLDGLVIADANKRVDPATLAASLNAPGVLYQRDNPTAGGRGSRMAALHRGSQMSAMVVVEHRFRTGHFDAIDEVSLRKWATLAAVAMQLRAPQSSAESASSLHDSAPPAESTSVRGVYGDSTSTGRRTPSRQYPAILGSSRALRSALARLDAAVESDLPALIVGETGVGKELFSRALHDYGSRAKKPFIAINCGAIPDALFEAELFGHARGSFTGADRARAGLLVQAEGGTLLLDEIGELPVSRQAVLLRALETRRYRPVGSDEERTFNVRIVAATSRDLEKAVASGSFRRDLLYRLNVLEIRVPALRERRDDIPLLATSFLDVAEAPSDIAADAMAALMAYDWPGNVRELEHTLQRLATMNLSTIERRHLSRPIRAAIRATPHAAPYSKGGTPPSERTEVERALKETQGNITHAARVLGLTRHGLKKRMTRLGMREAK